MSCANLLCYELYDHIISILHDDNKSLRACSLVCRAWVPASQYHLFHHLTLAGCSQSQSSSHVTTPCRRIFAVILSSPHIARYVNKLSVQDHIFPSRPRAYPWVSMEITFPPLLKKLSFLKQLEFNFSPCRSSEHWPAIACGEIKEALSSIPLESLAFRHFSFNSIVDIIKILVACRNLKILHLYNVDILDKMYLSTTSLESILSMESLLQCPGQSKKPNIERLTLRSNKATSFISILLHLRSPVDLSSLHHFNINVSPDNYFDFAQLLRCVQRLKFLEMDIDSSFEYDTLVGRNNIIDISFVPSLVPLHLQLHLLLSRVDPIPWVITFLSAVGPQNALEDIFLTFILKKPPPTFTIQAFEITLAEWRRLNHLLTQSPFSGLRRIRLVFVLVDDQSLGQLSDEFTAQLQGLSGKGVLEVNHNVPKCHF